MQKYAFLFAKFEFYQKLCYDIAGENMNIQIVGYDEKYADQIDAIEAEEWEVTGARVEVEEGAIFWIALDEEKVIGTLYGRQVGDLFHIDVLIIQKDYRFQGVGTLLMQKMLEEMQKKNIRNIVGTVVFSNGKMNAENIMKLFDFRELFRIKGYWGADDPNTTCKICHHKPCDCTCVIFLKELK